MKVQTPKEEPVDSFDRNYLRRSQEFFKNFLPSKSSELIEKLILVILKKFNQYGMKNRVIQALAMNFSKSNAMSVEWGKLICWVAAVRFLIQNDPNPVQIQEFVQAYPYLIEYNLFSNERLHLQRFERAMYYLSKLDIPLAEERQIVFRICRYFEQCSVIDLDHADNNRIAIYERYVALTQKPLQQKQAQSTLQQRLQDTSSTASGFLLNQKAVEELENYRAPEVIRFSSSNASPESVKGMIGCEASIPFLPLLPPAIAASVPTFTHWTIMPDSDIAENYWSILNELRGIEEIDQFSERIHHILN